jgi:hypothetical protein
MERKGRYRKIDDEQSNGLQANKWRSVPLFNDECSSTSPPTALLFTNAVIFAISLVLHGLMKSYLSIDKPCTKLRST